MKCRLVFREDHAIIKFLKRSHSSARSPFHVRQPHFDPEKLCVGPHLSCQRLTMKFLDHIRPKPRSKSTNKYDYTPPRQGQRSNISTPRFAANPTAQFPATLLEKLLRYACPHDDNYNSCEDSTVDGGCMLCNLKDLSQCALVSRQWSGAAENVLSVRHRCPPLSFVADCHSPGTTISVLTPFTIAIEKTSLL